MSRKDSLSLGLESLFCYPRRLNPLLFINNIDQLNYLVYNTLLVWQDVKQYPNIAPVISPSSPGFESKCTSTDQEYWFDGVDLLYKGLSAFTDLLVSDSVKSFEQIRADFNITHKYFQTYLQICHFVGSLLRAGGTHTSIRLSELENTIVLAKSPKGLISKIYTSLLYTDSSHYDSLKLLWESDLEVTFNTVDWDKICSQFFPKSISIQERTLKLVMLLC